MSVQQSAAPEMLAGRYVLSDLIRKGAQATVTKAFDRKTSNVVAVKRVKFGPDDKRAREGFRREPQCFSLSRTRYPDTDRC